MHGERVMSASIGRRRLTAGLALVVFAGAILGLPALQRPVQAACPPAGVWLGTEGTPLDAGALFRDLAASQVVLLGERHDRLEHHRWQAHTLAALHAHRPDLVIGLEMLPREAQPALDAWVAGELTEQEFIARSRWYEAWGFDPQLYMPVLHFARLHRIPVRAINLDRALVARLAAEGWEAVPASERHDIPAPAPESAAYRDWLAKILEDHPTGAHDGGDLDRFVAGQLVWDRAMAAGLAASAAEGRLAVGLMGVGHLVHGYGVPHQLRDLGIAAPRTLLPWAAGTVCEPVSDGLADAVFGIPDDDRFEPPKPLMLGVRIEADPAGVRVLSVGEGTVAAATGLAEGDVLTRAGERPLAVPGDLVAQIRRQIPGSVLPLTVLREGEERELLARFPDAPR
jgi:uncharacterized iron-regulated protein